VSATAHAPNAGHRHVWFQSPSSSATRALQVAKATHLAALDGWTVTDVARHFRSAEVTSAVDLLDRDATHSFGRCAATHVYYATWTRRDTEPRTSLRQGDATQCARCRRPV
jgi:hypothetical protein